MIQNAILTSLQSRLQMTITSRAGLEKTLWRGGGGGVVVAIDKYNNNLVINNAGYRQKKARQPSRWDGVVLIQLES